MHTLWIELAFRLADAAVTELQTKVKAGTITNEDQLKARAAYNTFRQKADSLFEGDEWKIDAD